MKKLYEINKIVRFHNEICINYNENGESQEIWTDDFEIEDNLWVSDINTINYLIKINENEEGFSFEIVKK